MKNVKKHIIIALVIYLFDVCFLNQGVLTFFFVLLAVIFAFIPKLIFSLFKKNKKLALENLILIVIYILLVIAVFFSVRLINNYASYNAQKMVKICNDYHLKYHKYPDKLEDLVPEFLPSIPRAKPVGVFSNFNYFISSKNEHILWYVVFPPHGRRFYNLEKGTENTRLE